MCSRLQEALKGLNLDESKTEDEDGCASETTSQPASPQVVAPNSPNTLGMIPPAPDPDTVLRGHKPEDYSCENCAELLAKLSECEICMNPLQNSKMVACARCGGIWCGGCARRVSRCPFCRASPPRNPSVVLNKLLANLNLPCRNQRWGCVERLTSESRQSHESSCKFGQIVCPVEEDCKSCMPMSGLSTHITSNHRMTAVNSRRVNIVIDKFETKMMRTAMTKHKYKICLLAFGHAFMIKVCLFNFSLHVSAIKRSIKMEIQNPNEPLKNEAFCAFVEFHSAHSTNKSTVLVGDKVYNKTTLLHRGDCAFRSWPGQNVKVLVSINKVINDEEVVVLL